MTPLRKGGQCAIRAARRRASRRWGGRGPRARGPGGGGRGMKRIVGGDEDVMRAEEGVETRIARHERQRTRGAGRRGDSPRPRAGRLRRPPSRGTRTLALTLAFSCEIPIIAVRRCGGEFVVPIPCGRPTRVDRVERACVRSARSFSGEPGAHPRCSEARRDHLVRRHA